jgi:uncharacterized protein (DUF1778 family)
MNSESFKKLRHLLKNLQNVEVISDMNIEIKIDDKTADLLQEIAELKGCSVSAAAFLVLERYAERAKREIESAHRAAERIKGNR